MPTFTHLVRFVEGGQAVYGDLLECIEEVYTVHKLRGSPFGCLEPTNEVVKTDRLLCPIERTPLVICIGLNYKTHAREAKLPLPIYPAVFCKPADALAGPSDVIHTHPDTRGMLDYEGELVVVIGKDAKDVTEADALDYVLGYSAGNDVSARNFQLPEASGGQFCYAKSFDSFAPIGHAIVAPVAFPEPLTLRITTKVNGTVKQDSSTDDMIFSVRQIISHLSRGTTLRKGTVIMTGTPSGVGYFRKQFLQDGDVVEIEVHGAGKIRNTISLAGP